MIWQYVPGEKRHKHKWKETYPDFIPSDGERVAKCPATIAADVATDLLRAGIPWHNPKRSRSYPDAIFNVHEGVIYKAVVTVPGRSYHGFPWDGPIPRRILKELTEVAREKKCEKEFKRWVSLHIR